jgi:hypothetical protein
MPLCESCLDLNGRASAAGLREGLILLGVGDLCGVPAVEHYRCIACGTSFSRVLVGDRSDCVWRLLGHPEAQHP